MEQNTATPTEPTAAQSHTQELVRPTKDRVIAGVAQGLSNRYDFPAWVIRVLFALTAVFGGLGFVLYIAGWVLIRSEDESTSIGERFFSGASNTKSWVGIGLIFVAALIILDNLTFLSGGVIWAVALLVVGVLLYTGQIPFGTNGDESESKEGVQPVTATDTAPLPATKEGPSGDSPSGGGLPPTPAPTPPVLPPSASKPKEKSILGRLTIGFMLLGVGVLALLDNLPDVPVYPEPRHYLALAVTILGVGLLVGTIAGRARWLILVAVVLVPTLMFSPVFEWEWESDTFESTIEPSLFIELDDAYSLDVGNLQIDLTDLPWDGEVVELDASVDIGNLEIRIPAEVDIVGTASVDIGRVGTHGRESAGIGSPSLDFAEDGSDTGTVLLDAHVDMGNIDIYNR